MSHHKLVLVTGAAGQQGGAVTRELLNRGHHVRAMTRRPDSRAAEALRSLGADVIHGDFDDAESLRVAAGGADAVFAMSAFAELGPDAETRQGRAVADAAVAAGVGHFVYTSVASADRAGVPHFDSKYRVEQHLAATGLAYTIIRPVYFMENAITFGAAALALGTLRMAMAPDRPLQQVSVADVGTFAALAIDNPDRFIGRTVEIAGDELSGEQAAKIISDVVGVPVAYEEIPVGALAPGLPQSVIDDLARMYEFFDRVGMDADVEGLRRTYPDVGWRRFPDWAAEQDWQTLLGRRRPPS